MVYLEAIRAQRDDWKGIAMWKPVMRNGQWIVVDHDTAAFPRVLLDHDDIPLAFKTYQFAQDEADALNRPETAN